MQILHHIHDLRNTISKEKNYGKTIALVPTMGNLHEGHLQLVRRAHEVADIVVVSIFVNPMQFGASEDLDNYPNTPIEDQQKLEKERSHYLFLPNASEVYPNGIAQHTKVNIEHLGNILCGVSRPVHFEGVCTVVNKLFNLVQPTIALFGEKDFQQLTVIRRMVQDLCMPIDIIGVPTQREPNGLAMSSRNTYLTVEQKEIASTLYTLLKKTRSEILAGNNEYSILSKHANNTLATKGFEPDYFEICDADNLSSLNDNSTTSNIAIIAAAYLGQTRLIDNLYFSLP